MSLRRKLRSKRDVAEQQFGDSDRAMGERGADPQHYGHGCLPRLPVRGDGMSGRADHHLGYKAADGGAQALGRPFPDGWDGAGRDGPGWDA